MTTKKSTGKKALKKTSKKKPSAASVSKVKRPKRAFRTYQQAIGYLFDQTDYEGQKRLRYNVTTFDLDRMNGFLKALGNPHKKVKTVHIAGTKGKGSTATMLGKMVEENFRRAVMMDGYSIFFTDKLAFVVLLITLFSFVWPLYKSWKHHKAKQLKA